LTGDFEWVVMTPTMTPPTIASTAAITITPVLFGEDRPFSLVMDSHLVNMPAARARILLGR
jgi:hypothetical protein